MTDEQYIDEQQSPAPNWTPDRPTRPGEYWLSLPPKQRTNQQSAIPVVCHPCGGGILGLYDGITGEWLNAVMSSDLDGALWAPRETPANPFAKTDPMRTDQDGREYYDREQKLTSDALIKKAIQHLRKRKPKNGRGYVYPLWKRVADLFGHGSGSAEICRRYGFDPDERWMPEQEYGRGDPGNYCEEVGA